jgi:hypothetical protein
VTARPGHLVARFAGSLLPIPVGADDLRWVGEVLTPAELGLWLKLRRADQRESVQVGRRAEQELGADARPEWLAAALLHDVGKTDARFGPYRRSVATVAGALAPSMVAAWRESSSDFTRRVALYLDHAAVGATAIRVAGGREAVAAWAEAHHDPERWSETGADGIPPEVCRTLARADGERV